MFYQFAEKARNCTFVITDSTDSKSVKSVAFFGGILMDDIKKVVKRKYGDAALRVISGSGSAQCSISPSFDSAASFYSAQEKVELPETAVQASLGCGNPTALAELKPGETVLDLGSGGGIDVLLSARRVSPGGKAYGLDMTDEMLVLSRENQKKAGIENVEFLKGEMENIPLPENSVDVIISNCVVNLSADKDLVLREAFRVLKPGGRLAVSDLVVRGELAQDIKKSVLLWAGCVAGALEENEYRQKLAAAGFGNIDVEPTGIFRAKDIFSFLEEKGFDITALASQFDGKLVSAFIRARKPS
jgi:ubiquinone/menaquinone biosynthesis C-methylase UbiE